MKFNKVFSFLLAALVLSAPVFATVEMIDGSTKMKTDHVSCGTGLSCSKSGTIVTVNADQSGNLIGALVVKTATGAVTATELKQTTIVNTGAAGAIVLSLPAPELGMEARVFLTDAQDVDINPADGTQILVLTNATGDAISSAATAGNQITLIGISATQWITTAASGTWTDVN